jgi:hypothetical protein
VTIILLPIRREDAAARTKPVERKDLLEEEEEVDEEGNIMIVTSEERTIKAGLPSREQDTKVDVISSTCGS